MHTNPTVQAWIKKRIFGFTQMKETISIRGHKAQCVFKDISMSISNEELDEPVKDRVT